MFRKTHIWGYLAVLLWIAPASQASAEHLVYTGQSEEIMELRLQDGNLLPDSRNWTFGGLGLVHSIDYHAGELYFTTTDDPVGNERLFVADLETGDATEIHNFGILGHVDIAFDETGVLWVVEGSRELYSYDPLTDQMTFVTTVAATEDVNALAWHGDRLHVLLQPVDADHGPVLAVVDVGTGALSEQRELGLIYTGPLFRVFDSMDFDDAGGLWIGGIDHLGLIDPPSEGWVAHFAYPSQDTSPTTQTVIAPYRFAMPVAVLGSSSPIAVPAADTQSLWILGALLALSAVLLVRRRALHPMRLEANIERNRS